MHREHETDALRMEVIASEPHFTDSIKSHLFFSLTELEHQLKNCSDAEAAVQTDECLQLVQSILTEMRLYPHNFEIIDDLFLLATKLTSNTYQETYKDRISMYVMYVRDLIRSYASTEGRFSGLATQMSYEELAIFSKHLADFLHTGDLLDSPKRRAFLRCFFLNDSSELDTSGPTHDKMQELYAEYFNHPLFAFLIPIFLRLQPYYAYELAMALNAQRDAELKKQVAAQLDPVEIAWQSEIALNNGIWFLCYASEDALMDTLSEQGYLVLVDAQKQPIILVKFKGKESGLVLKSFVTQTGQIIPAGLWISPVSPHTRTRLERVFDTKYQKMNIQLFDGQWAYMRSVNLDLLVQDGKQITLEELSAFLSRRTDYIGQHPGFSQERKVYRKKVYEVD